MRLNSPSAWSVADVPGPHWLQVDLGQTMAVKKVATQGRRIDSHFQWVTSYAVSSRVDASDWVVYTENSSVKVSQVLLCEECSVTTSQTLCPQKTKRFAPNLKDSGFVNGTEDHLQST